MSRVDYNIWLKIDFFIPHCVWFIKVKKHRNKKKAIFFKKPELTLADSPKFVIENLTNAIRETVSNMKKLIRLQFIIIFFPLSLQSQIVEKVVFDQNDKNSYYLAVPPLSGNIKGTLVFFTGFYSLERIIAESKLQNVAYSNDILTIWASTEDKLWADSTVLAKVDFILRDVIKKYTIDTSRLALGCYSVPGNIILRYAELAAQFPSRFAMRPKAIFGVDCCVDLFDLWHWCENEIKKNYDSINVGSAKYVFDAMTRGNGTIYKNPDRYSELTPFNHSKEPSGNERYLKDVAVRLYYDTDIEWYLKNKRGSYFDTNIPSGSELIKRLLLLGNNQAEFVMAHRGIWNNGIRDPQALSIVNEVECIQWLKKSLNIFDPNTWIRPYKLLLPEGWNSEILRFPIEFAQQIPYKGVEELRFPPGWADPKNEEHWSYAFLWWVEDSIVPTTSNLQKHLKEYYSGLVGRNMVRRNIPQSKAVPVQITLKEDRKTIGDKATYRGVITMLNYHMQVPITLNCVIHVKDCGSCKYTPILFELSPKGFSHPIWKKLGMINKSFERQLN